MYNKKIKIAIDKVLGYAYFTDKEHPLSSKEGKTYYHRHIISIKLGRWINRNEIVHHIDGNKLNNNPSNLILVTENSHQSYHAKHEVITRTCVCGVIFTTREEKQFYCSNICRGINTRKFKISKEELEKLIWKIPTTKIAKQFNVSDVAISKRCKLFNIKKPPRGYWEKIKHGIIAAIV